MHANVFLMCVATGRTEGTKSAIWYVLEGQKREEDLSHSNRSMPCLHVGRR